MKGNCLIAQSGGPTAAINATLAGVYSGAKKFSQIETIYGGLNGIEGIMKEKLVDLSPILDEGNNLELLKNTPSSFLGSCRYKLKGFDVAEDEYKRIFEVFEKFNIKYFFYIGGNDSMDTVLRLKQYQAEKNMGVTVIGVPKTIDNDLYEVDHTPGFGSAAKYIATTIKEIAADTAVYDMDSIVVAEVMGRNAGWLTLSAGLARDSKGRCLADLIYLPEIPFSYEKLMADIKKVMETKRQIVIVVSEGVKFADGTFIAEAKTKDMFGHGQLGGAAKNVEAKIKETLGVKTRSVEINVLQRCAAHYLSKTDIEESFIMGETGVKLAEEGKTGVMVGSVRKEGTEYALEIGCGAIENIANKEKKVPESYINADKNGLTEAAYEYLEPLVMGEVHVKTEKGIPVHLSIRDFI